jgi:hypothetical protein
MRSHSRRRMSSLYVQSYDDGRAIRCCTISYNIRHDEQRKRDESSGAGAVPLVFMPRSIHERDRVFLICLNRQLSQICR